MAWKVHFDNDPMLAGLFREIHEMSMDVITGSRETVKIERETQAATRETQAISKENMETATEIRGMMNTARMLLAQKATYQALHPSTYSPQHFSASPPPRLPGVPSETEDALNKSAPYPRQ